MATRIRRISDPVDLRALAHPLRLRLLGALRLDGPATASELARRFGVSSGLTSYHLRALAERGFVEDDPGRGGGRERWWRAAHDAHAWAGADVSDADERAGRLEATRALNVEVARVYGRYLEQFARSEPDMDEAWRRSVTMFDRWMPLTPARLTELVGEIEAVLDRYQAAADESPEPGAERVGVMLAGFRAAEVLP